MPKREVVSRWGAIHLGERKAPWDFWWEVVKNEHVHEERENGRTVNGNRSGSGLKHHGVWLEDIGGKRNVEAVTTGIGAGGKKREVDLQLPKGVMVKPKEVLEDKGWPR